MCSHQLQCGVCSHQPAFSVECAATNLPSAWNAHPPTSTWSVQPLQCGVCSHQPAFSMECTATNFTVECAATTVWRVQPPTSAWSVQPPTSVWSVQPPTSAWNDNVRNQTFELVVSDDQWCMMIRVVSDDHSGV